jgi:isoquinoline 1-oxidoreductase beta subunit
VDTTGGNSGSPTLNAKGELCGLLFDGTYESLGSDFVVSPNTRSIHVDSVYMLWMMDAVDGAHNLRQAPIGLQVEGGIALGLSAALYGEITVKNGRIQQTNFHDYPLLTIDQMPVIETHIVPSTAAPTGVGEPPVRPIAPAVGNAIFALTGKRLRKLPFATV